MSMSLVQRRKSILAGAAGATFVEGGVSELAASAWRTLRTWQQRHESRQHLVHLDDRLLADMGLTRADAEAEAAKPMWRA